MSAPPVIRTTGGRVLGTVTGGDAGVRTYVGIPYAAPPIGPARFAAPAPASTWDGVRLATAPGPTAPAPARPDFGGLDLAPVLGLPWSPHPADTVDAASDYLTVTVTTPADPSGGLPVLVYIHGGGFVSGTGQAALYDGSAFARDGIIVVTVNYRLGISGWLDLPGAPPNRGLLDVLAALYWVAENLRAFGGDPDRVTLAGQSAGAMIVAALLCADTGAASPPFARAISQSGSGITAITTEQAAATTRAVADALGVRATVEDLTAIDDRRFVDILTHLGPVPLLPGGARDASLGSSPFRCVIDGQILTGQPADVVRADHGADVDLLIGTNSDEANLYTIPTDAASTMTQARLLALAERRIADPEPLVAGRSGRAAAELASRIITESFVRGSQLLADAHALRQPGRTYAYEFAWRSAAFGGELGACHCLELPFVFANLDLPVLHGETALLGSHRPPPELADRMHAAWVAFIRDGNPEWPAYDTDHHFTQRIDEEWSRSRKV